MPRSFNKRQKQSNWQFLNERVFDRIGFKIDDQLINDIIERDKKKLTEFVAQLKKMLEEHYPKVNTRKFRGFLKLTPYFQIPVDPKSSKMMLRPLEEIYKIPAVINSTKSRRKVHKLRSFNLLDEADRQILLDKDKLLSQHRVCINELEARFKALQGDIKERKLQIHNLESGKVEGKFSNTLLLRVAKTMALEIEFLKNHKSVHSVTCLDIGRVLDAKVLANSRFKTSRNF